MEKIIKMRTANLILHRKVDSKAECICGSKMDYIEGNGHCCKRQMRNKEPNIIRLEELGDV